ncbi:hypothetical protein ACIGKQ_03915 [Gordonia sp. NPDC062954]|uniref:hypothetical protein n=1 Tax=Gordonia sp. NPDC062954 TaxID=3364003 RepID=UPI0037CA3A00
MTGDQHDDLDDFVEWTRRYRLKEQESFQPQGAIEQTVLNMIGAYENVVSRANWLCFHQAGPDGVADRERLVPALRRAIEAAGIEDWSIDAFATQFDKVNTARNRLAHMLWVDEVTGDWPNRSLRVVVRGKVGEPKGRGELEWFADGWSRKNTHTVQISEQELYRTLDRLWSLRNSLLKLGRAFSIAAENKARNEAV